LPGIEEVSGSRNPGAPDHAHAEASLFFPRLAPASNVRDRVSSRRG
jgi:hypothetical protein